MIAMDIESNEEAVALWKLSTNPRHRNKAMKAILKRNKGLLQAHGRKVINQRANMDDFIQDASIQMLADMEKFDMSLGLKFISYCAHTLKAAVHKTNGTSEIISPKYRPKPKEDVKKGQSRFMWKRKEYVSLNLKDESGRDLMNLFKSPPPPDKSEAGLFLSQLIEILTPEEKRVLFLKFGINSSPHSNEEIGYLIHKTRESVRLILDKGLKKMRDHAKRKQLAGDALFSELWMNL